MTRKHQLKKLKEEAGFCREYYEKNKKAVGEKRDPDELTEVRLE
jgi:hypothetical protein